MPLSGQKKHKLSFQDLKNALSNALVLVCLDFSWPFIVEIDGSGKGLGLF